MLRLISAFLLLGLILLSAGVQAKKEGKLDGLFNPGHHEQPSWFKTSFLDLPEDVAEAKEEGKHVILYFFQDGCPYCQKLLEVNFAQKPIVEQTRSQFEVIAINMWGDREVVDTDGEHLSEKQFALKRKVMFTPTLIFLDQQGGKALRLNGYYPTHQFRTVLDYVGNRHYQNQKFADFVEANLKPAAHGELHQQPFLQQTMDLRRWGEKNSKPLLVLFEQKDCPACDELHAEVFTRAETLKQLEAFDVVQLNMWSRDKLFTPDGRSVAVRDWAKELDVNYAPSALMLLAGKEVFRMEAYLKAFHVQSSLEYVSSGEYLKEPSFQRYIEARADALRDQGVEIELMQ